MSFYVIYRHGRAVNQYKDVEAVSIVRADTKKAAVLLAEPWGSRGVQAS